MASPLGHCVSVYASDSAGWDRQTKSSSFHLCTDDDDDGGIVWMCWIVRLCLFCCVWCGEMCRCSVVPPLTSSLSLLAIPQIPPPAHPSLLHPVPLRPFPCCPPTYPSPSSASLLPVLLFGEVCMCNVVPHLTLSPDLFPFPALSFPISLPLSLPSPSFSTFSLSLLSPASHLHSSYPAPSSSCSASPLSLHLLPPHLLASHALSFPTPHTLSTATPSTCSTPSPLPLTLLAPHLLPFPAISSPTYPFPPHLLPFCALNPPNPPLFIPCLFPPHLITFLALSSLTPALFLPCYLF